MRQSFHANAAGHLRLGNCVTEFYNQNPRIDLLKSRKRQPISAALCFSVLLSAGTAVFFPQFMSALWMGQPL